MSFIALLQNKKSLSYQCRRTQPRFETEAGANGPLASKFNCGIACLRCFSATGKSGSKQPLSLGKGCTTKGVVIHELLHALGMMHEHCRADRDQFIRINFKNVRPSKWNELLNGFYVKF